MTIINIKIVHRTKDGFGIGIIDKTFNVLEGGFVGGAANSSSYYYEGTIYNNGSSPVKYSGYKTGDTVTVDINLNTRTLNFALNGNYLAADDIIKNIPKQVALDVNMYYKNDSEIYIV